MGTENYGRAPAILFLREFPAAPPASATHRAFFSWIFPRLPELFRTVPQRPQNYLERFWTVRLFHPTSVPFPSHFRPSSVPLPSHFRPTSVPLPSLFRPASVLLPLPSHFRPSSVPLPSHFRPFSSHFRPTCILENLHGSLEQTPQSNPDEASCCCLCMAAPKLRKLATSHMPVRLPNSTLSMKSFSILAHFDPTSCSPLITSNRFWNVFCMIYELHIFSVHFLENLKNYMKTIYCMCLFVLLFAYIFLKHGIK